MLQQVFGTILEMSIAAGYCAVFVTIIRFMLRKLPRSYSYILWAVVFLRLMLPVLPESDWSLMPGRSLKDTIADVRNGSGYNSYDLFLEEYTQNSEGASSADMTFGQQEPVGAEAWETQKVLPVFVSAPSQESGPQTSAKTELFAVCAVVWLSGVAVILLYSTVKNLCFRRQLAASIAVEEGVFETEGLKTAFVTGLTKPRIYLPVDLDKQYIPYVLEHERTHIKRGDNLVKHVTYILTCLHWFNPLIRVAFYLMCKDMEMSCDELVLHSMGFAEKQRYSIALLSVASGRKLQLGVPIAFSESHTKSRIKNVLKYRKPTRALTVTATGVILAVTAGLLCNPSEYAVNAGDMPEVKKHKSGNTRQVITVGVSNKEYRTEPGWSFFEGGLEGVVARYNAQSEEYFVEIVSLAEDWSSYYEKQDMIVEELKNGNGTDVIFMEGLPEEELGVAGVFADLQEFISEEEWNTVYVGNVLDAMKTGDDLYSIGMCFSVYTLIADGSLAGLEAGWTIEEMRSFLNKSGKGARALYDFSTDEPVIITLTTPILEDFVNWEKGSCNFETEEFYQLLEFSKEQDLSRKAGADTDSDRESGSYFAEYELFTGTHYRLKDAAYGGNVQIKGTPTPYGNGVAAMVYEKMGIYNHSECKEGAWDFIRFCMGQVSDRYPIQRACLNDYFAEELYLGATLEDIQATADMIDLVDRNFDYCAEYSRILTEETRAYYQNEITVKEAAERIQIRMSEYLENCR